MPYIYRVENNLTNQFYYGARYVETVAPDQDIWVNYFTSSKSVKKLIETYGRESFTISILETHVDADICYQHEQAFIKLHIENPLCLNKQYRECGNVTFLNKSHSDETRAKLSIANKGRIPWNKGISPSEETRLKLSTSGKGKSGVKPGTPSPKKGLPSPLKGRRKS
jgi:group I intron endonuclease